MTTAFIHGV